MADGTRLRIAIFASNYPPHLGGLEIVVWHLARGLAQRHDVVLVTSAFGDATGVTREGSLTVHRLPTVHVTEQWSVPYPVPTGRGLRAALADTANADVVHVHGALYVQAVLGRVMAQRAHVPFVLTEHVGFVGYSSALVNAVQRAAWRVIGDPMVRRAAAVVTLSARVQTWLAERIRPDVRFIGNGVDFARFRPRADERAMLRRSFNLPEHETLVLFAGRDSAKKNLELALGIPRDGFTLVLCGGRRALVGEKLIDLGVLPHERMADLYACVDLTVHTASGEGFPLAVQESVASGTPVVLLWDDGYGRWMPKELVAACDEPADVGPQLAALVGDSVRRASMADAGRAWAEQNWSWEANVAAYEEIYREVIEHARGH